MRVPRFIPTGLTLVALGLCSAVALMGTASPASAAASTTVMKTGQKLLPGHAVRSAEVQAACDSFYWELRLQSNGNLVERQVFPCLNTQAVYWQTRSYQKPAYLLLDRVGDLVLVNTSGRRVWQTGTGGLGVTHLAIGGDGNMQMLTAAGAGEWTSHWGVCSQQPLSNGRESTIVSTACRAAGYPGANPLSRALWYCIDQPYQTNPYGAPWAPNQKYCPDDKKTYPTNVVDCSGLTRWAVHSAIPSITLDHSAYDQDNSMVTRFNGTRIARANLLPGDLVFFWGGDSPHPGHVGIYIGNNYLIDAFNSGYRVQIHSMSWENTYGSHRPGHSSNYMGAVRYW